MAERNPFEPPPQLLGDLWPPRGPTMGPLASTKGWPQIPLDSDTLPPYSTPAYFDSLPPGITKADIARLRAKGIIPPAQPSAMEQLFPTLSAVTNVRTGPTREVVTPQGKIYDPDAGILESRSPWLAGTALAFDISQLLPVGPGAIGGGLAKLAMAAAPAAKKVLAKTATNAGAPGQALGDLLGQFPTTTAAHILNKTKEGDYFVKLPTGVEPQTGLMVGQYRTTDPRNLVVPSIEQLHIADIERFVQTNAEALAKEASYLGTWRDPETGKVYLSVLRRFDPDQIRQATKFGERTGQLTGFNRGTSETFPIGDWNKFIQSDEFHRRMDDMAKVGSDYLKQFPTKDLWGFGPISRTYGGRLPDEVTASYIAATAPVTALRWNLQQASEYARRHIAGEPILQPDWRAGEGLMSMQPGSMMPLESSRVLNLERARRGAVGELSADKVRNEAQALLGDPNAFVGDRWWARLAEKPSAGVFTELKEGVMSNPKVYRAVQDQVVIAAQRAGRDVRDYSADVWIGIRETVQKNNELFGTPYRGHAIPGESKSYADHFNDLVADKAAHLRITPRELEKRLRAGDANLLSVMLSTPAITWLVAAQQRGEPASRPGPASSPLPAPDL